MFSAIVTSGKFVVLLWLGTFFFAQLINAEDAKWVKRKPFALMATFYIVGMLGQNYYLVYAVVIAAVPIMCKDRGEAAGLFIVALGSMTDISTGFKVGGATLLGIDKWVCLAFGLAWVQISRPRIGLRPGVRYDVPFLIMLALEFSQARDMNFTSTFRTLLSTALAIGLPYFVLVNSIGRVQDLRRVMVALVYIAFILAFLAIGEAVNHVLFYHLIPQRLGILSTPYFRLLKFRGGMLRAMTSFGDATAFAQFLIIGLTATMACRESFRSTSKLVLALAILSFGIFVTSSRNAWIGVIICVLGFDLFRKRYLAMAGKLSLLGMAYAVILLIGEFVPYISTMLGKGGETADTATYRSQLLTRGIEEFSKNPYFGLGISKVIVNMQDMIQGEGIVDFVNAYVFYALTMGIGGLIGLALVFLLPCSAMLQTRRAMRVQSPFLQRTTAFVFAVCLSYFVTSAFTAFGGRNSTYLYMTLGIGAVLYSWRKIPAALLASTDRERRGRDGQIIAPVLRPPETERPRRRRRSSVNA